MSVITLTEIKKGIELLRSGPIRDRPQKQVACRPRPRRLGTRRFRQLFAKISKLQIGRYSITCENVPQKAMVCPPVHNDVDKFKRAALGGGRLDFKTPNRSSSIGPRSSDR